jgi:hypothetical protein
MPLLLVGLRRLGVAPLVVADDPAHVLHLGPTAAAAEHRRAAVVQRPAHLLGRHLGIFPPAAAGCGRPRSRARSGNPTTGGRFAAARLHADGTLDATFGSGGKEVFAARDNDEIHNLVLPDDGAGQKMFCGQDLTAPLAGNNFAVGQLLPDGTPDSSFAAGSPFPGIRVSSFGAGHSDATWGLLRQPFDGKLVVVGGTEHISQFGDALADFALARLTPNGDLYAGGFGVGGQTTLFNANAEELRPSTRQIFSEGGHRSPPGRFHQRLARKPSAGSI